MKKLVCFLILFFPTVVLYGQDYSSFTNTIQKLSTLTTEEEIDKAWNELVEAEHIPYVFEDSVAFLYRGEASSVSWIGDFNRCWFWLPEHIN